jgi:hypothetical protein
MRLNPPSNFDPYGGPSKSFQPSADGKFYFCQNGWYNQVFGLYVLVQDSATGIARVVSYGDFLKGNGRLELGGDGILYVVGSRSDTSEFCEAFIVPGYVRYTSAGPQPVPIPVIAPVVDVEARNAAAAASASANTARIEVKKLGERLSGLIVPTAQQIAEVAWAKANDAIYASANGGYLAAYIWQKALDAAYAFCKGRGLVQ